jgi:hypothetical protein
LSHLRIQADDARVADPMLDEADEPVLAHGVEEPGNIGVQNVVHLSAVDPDMERVQRIVLAAARAESIAEPEEFLLVDRIQQRSSGPLDGAGSWATDPDAKVLQDAMDLENVTVLTSSKKHFRNGSMARSLKPSWTRSPYQAALEEQKRDRLPVDWAITTGNQGIALMLLAQRLGDANRARLAVQQIEIASVTMRDHGNAALAADYNRQALKAQAVLRQLSMR